MPVQHLDERFADLTEVHLGLIDMGFAQEVGPFPISRVAVDTGEGGMETVKEMFNPDSPVFKEFKGEAVSQEFEPEEVSIDKRKWKRSLSVDKDFIRNRKTSPMVNQNLRNLGLEGRRLDYRILADRLMNGTSLTAWDGQNVFDTSHNLLDGSGTWSNNLTTTSLTIDNLFTAKQRLREFVDRQGEPIGVLPDLLIVGPQLEQKAREILESPQLDHGGTTSGMPGPRTNIAQGMVDLAVFDYITDDSWYVLGTRGGARKPFWRFLELPFNREVDDTDWAKRDVRHYVAEKNVNVNFLDFSTIIRAKET